MTAMPAVERLIQEHRRGAQTEAERIENLRQQALEAMPRMVGKLMAEALGEYYEDLKPYAQVRTIVNDINTDTPWAQEAVIVIEAPGLSKIVVNFSPFFHPKDTSGPDRRPWSRKAAIESNATVDEMEADKVKVWKASQNRILEGALYDTCDLRYNTGIENAILVAASESEGWEAYKEKEARRASYEATLKEARKLLDKITGEKITNEEFDRLLAEYAPLYEKLDAYSKLAGPERLRIDRERHQAREAEAAADKAEYERVREEIKAWAEQARPIYLAQIKALKALREKEGAQPMTTVAVTYGVVANEDGETMADTNRETCLGEGPDPEGYWLTLDRYGDGYTRRKYVHLVAIDAPETKPVSEYQIWMRATVGVYIRSCGDNSVQIRHMEIPCARDRKDMVAKEAEAIVAAHEIPAMTVVSDRVGTDRIDEMARDAIRGRELGEEIPY